MRFYDVYTLCPCYVCRLIMNVAYDVCRILGFLVCHLWRFVAVPLFLLHWASSPLLPAVALASSPLLPSVALAISPFLPAVALG